MMMMEMKTLLLLQLQLAGVCVSLPPPSSVSISSFNMQHTLSFLPSLESPTHCRYAVQTVRLSRRKSWRSVAACSELMAGQTCNLTLVFKDPFESYLARVKAYTSSQTSNWTQSAHFQPLTDTVFGPPGLTVSGCGNCLLLHLTVPASGGLKQQLQLRDLYRSLEFQVKRTRDGAQYLMSVPFSEQVVISYLQTGVEYCVSVRVSGLLTSTSSLFSQPHCAFTSPPSPLDKSVLLVLGLTGALCALCLFLSGLVIYRGGRSFRRCSLLSALSSLLLRQDRGRPRVSSQTSSTQLHKDDSLT